MSVHGSRDRVLPFFTVIVREDWSDDLGQWYSKFYEIATLFGTWDIMKTRRRFRKFHISYTKPDLSGYFSGDGEYLHGQWKRHPENWK